MKGARGAGRGQVGGRFKIGFGSCIELQGAGGATFGAGSLLEKIQINLL